MAMTRLPNDISLILQQFTISFTAVIKTDFNPTFLGGGNCIKVYQSACVFWQFDPGDTPGFFQLNSKIRPILVQNTSFLGQYERIWLEMVLIM